VRFFRLPSRSPGLGGLAAGCGRFAVALGLAAIALGGDLWAGVALADAQPSTGGSGPMAVVADAASAKLRYDALAAELAGNRRKVAALETAYAKQTADIERLKQQRPSWRRDRELEKALAASLEAAKTLEAAQRAALGTQRRLESQRTLAREAIARELPAATSTKLVTLKAWQIALSPPAPRRKILMPNLALDPYADPEDLLQQAGEIRQTEIALAREIALLDAQAARWEAIAALREAAQRSSELASAQSTDARRIAATARASTVEPAIPPAGPVPPPSPSPSDGDPMPGGGWQDGLGTENGGVVSIAVALGSVLDGETRRALEASEASRDPRARAKAVAAAKRAAAAKLETMRRQRVLIEQRASQNR
jgi:hypothetical protein